MPPAFDEYSFMIWHAILDDFNYDATDGFISYFGAGTELHADIA